MISHCRASIMVPAFCLGVIFYWQSIAVGLATAASTTITLQPNDDLVAAVAKAREAQQPVTLRLAAGRYEIREPLRIDEKLTGMTIEPDSEIDHVEIVGSRRISGWQCIDPARNVWKVEIQDTRAQQVGVRPAWEPRQLFINGVRAPRARTPNEGWMTTTSGFSIQNGATFLRLANDDNAAQRVSESGELIFTAKWVTMRSRPTEYNSDTREVIIRAANPQPQLSENSHWYAWENTSDALDQPNEWRHDSTTGTLYLLAPKGSNPNDMQVTIPRHEHLLTIDRADQVTVRGVEFSESDYNWPWLGRYDAQAACDLRGMVQVRNSRGTVIEECQFKNCGGYGVDVGAGAEECIVRRCELLELGAGGVRIGEMDRSAARCGGHLVEDCSILRYGRIHPAGCGVIIFQSDNNHVLHNEIAQGFYTGVSVGWNWGYQASPCHHNEIAWNHVHDLGFGVLSDMGGIYTLGPQPGTIIHHNFFHDITRRHYGGWGLYTDEGSTGIVLEKNIVARCQSAGFHQHYGKDNIVRNNLFIDCEDHSLMRTREENHNSFTFESNVVVAQSGTLLGSNWSNGNFIMRNNLWWDKRHGANTSAYRFADKSWEAWQAAGHDGGSQIADPKLRDVEHPELGLATDSPARELGWEFFDLTEVGPTNQR